MEYPGQSEPLLMLCYSLNRNLVVRAIGMGVSPNQRDTFGNTVLVMASMDNNASFARQILDAGADPNTTNDMGETPFTYACANDSWDTARVLADGGADINAKINDGATGLDWAKWHASSEFYAWLVSIGCVHSLDVPGWVGPGGSPPTAAEGSPC